MPETAPCTISVFKGGAPLPDIEVTLYREDGNGPLQIEGKTDSSGVAQIGSAWGTYSIKGAPIGKNKVTIMKHFAVPDELSSEAIERLSPQEQEQYEKKLNEQIDRMRPIPKELSSVSSTPFEVEIAPKTGGSLKIEVNDHAAP